MINAREAHSMMDAYNHSVDTVVDECLERCGYCIEACASIGKDSAYVDISDYINNDEAMTRIINAIETFDYQVGFNKHQKALIIYW